MNATCLWCGADFERRTTGGKVQRYCSTVCRRAIERAARAWAIARVERGETSVEEIREGAEPTPALHTFDKRCCDDAP